MNIITLFFLVPLIGIGQAVENSVSINVKSSVNAISERFISYEASFSELMNFCRDQNSLKNLSVISPAYIKLQGFSSYLKNVTNENLEKQAAVAEMMETLK